jgi:formamidopyrimidine-DNA glycosylase
VRAALEGRLVQAVLRKGKYFWFDLAGDGPDLLMHFGMTGYLAVKDVGEAKYVRIKDSKEWPPKFTKLEVVFNDGTTLAFADARRYILSPSS